MQDCVEVDLNSEGPSSISYEEHKEGSLYSSGEESKESDADDPKDDFFLDLKTDPYSNVFVSERNPKQ